MSTTQKDLREAIHAASKKLLMETIPSFHGKISFLSATDALNARASIVAEVILSALAALPPEVTPEQGKGEVMQAKLDDLPRRAQERAFITADDSCLDSRSTGVEPEAEPPASGPSPAAMEAAKEVMYQYSEPLKDCLNPERIIAAIIDRKFPREEDGAKALPDKPPAAKLPIFDKNHEAMNAGDFFIYQVGTPYAQTVQIEIRNGVEFLAFKDPYNDQPLADFWYAATDEEQSLKCAALQDSREGSK